jgi:ABC-type uncharacterized transport system involved in gliding motility auxiliary subunit
VTSIKESISGTIGIVLLLGIIVAVNVIFSGVSAGRIDLTEENLYTLSDGTRTMLKGLDRDVTLKFYYSRSGGSMPVPIKRYAQRVNDLLGEYESAGGGRLTVEMHDPKPFSDDEEWAQKYGLTPQSTSMMGGDAFYLGIVGISGAKEASIPILDTQAEPQLEYRLTRLIYEVTQVERPKLGIMSSLPVMGGPPQMPFGQPPQRQQPLPKWLFVTELENFYEVVQVDVTAESIDEDITALLVHHPKSLGDKTLYALDQFVMKGGRLMAFVDPMCMSDQAAAAPNQFMPPQSASDLNTLTGGWGVELTSGKVVGDMKAATTLQVGGGQVERVITWLSLDSSLIDRDEVATSSLEFLMLPVAGALTTNSVEGVSLTVLASTSDNSGVIDSFQAMGPSSATAKALEKRDPAPLIVRITGTLKSAFPGGPPSSDPAADDEGEEGEAVDSEAATNHLEESSGESVIVLVADADMLADQNCVRQVRTFFGPQLQPINDNLNFILNFAEQLCGSEALIGLRSRGRYQRPFTRVEALRETAHAEWQLEEEKLQSKLTEVQSKLSELESGKESDGLLILSPEQKAEIKKFNEERFKTQQDLKEVQKSLVRDIERLGMWVKGINIAAVPLLVAVYGIARGVSRRKSAQR